MERIETKSDSSVNGSEILLSDFSNKVNSYRSQVHYIGLGQAGTNVLVHFHNKGLSGIYTCFTNHFTDHLSKDMTHHPFRSDHSCASNDPGIFTSELEDALSQEHYYIIIAGLGGSVGTCLIQPVIRFLERRNNPFKVICSMPFYFEGRSRIKFAAEIKSRISEYKNIFFFDHNNLINNKQTTVREAFKQGNEQFYKLYSQNIVAETLIQKSEKMDLIISLRLNRN